MEVLCSWDLVTEASGMCHYQVTLLEGASHESATRELTINYGDRSNEEFFFLYGFVPNMNPNDVLRIHLRENTVRAEHRVFRHQSPSPSLVLPGGDALRAAQENVDTVPVGELTSLIPKEVWDRLIMISEGRQKQSRLSIESNDETSGSVETEPRDPIDKLVQVLEEYEEILEGVLGTGPLEKDIEILENFVYGKEPQWLWNVCVYRSTQKKLNREWLKVASKIKERLQTTSPAADER